MYVGLEVKTIGINYVLISTFSALEFIMMAIPNVFDFFLFLPNHFYNIVIL